MYTQSQDTAQMTRIEAARQAALGTLSRVRETLQVAATTVPTWARDAELKAGEQVDALLERVGLVRIARVEAKRPAAAETPETSAPETTEVEAAVMAAPRVEETFGTLTETVEEAAAETAAPVPASEPSSDRSSRRRRR